MSSELSEALSSAGLSLHWVGTDRASERPKIVLGATDPACVVFTSGSTGTPKGVVASHRYYIFHAATCTERGFGSDDRVALVIPMSFAYGAIVFWRTMLLGATIFPHDPREYGIDSFATWCSEQQIGILDATPSLLRALARSISGTVDSLRIVECAGEALFARDAANISRHLPSACTFRNSIGSSETGAYAFYEIPKFSGDIEGIIPVGAGTPHKEITISDSEGQAVPTGSTGEIVVTSSFNANGYWNDPELTARRFTEADDGRTRYRTGDLGRWLPDGSLLHLGRSDGMVKIRGYLVEPAEVEAALLDTGLVHEAAAFGTRDSQGKTSLCAYVVPIDGIRSSNAAIRRSLRERVPEYFVPTSLVAVPELPKNDNNKINRALLKPIAERDLTPLRDDWELAVGQVWCSILGLEMVGSEDDFFSLGGDSLGVLELITAMAEVHGVTVHSFDLVECPTLGAFADRTRGPMAARGRVLVPLVEHGVGPPLFCFAGGGAVAGSFILLARYLNLDRPVYGLQARGIEGSGIPDWSVERSASRCVREIRKVQPHGPYYLAGHCFGGVLAWEAGQQLKRAGEEVALLVLIDTVMLKWKRIDLEMGGGDQPSRGLSPSRSITQLKSLRRARWGLREFVRINATGIWPKMRTRTSDDFARHAEMLYRRYQLSSWDGPTVMYWAETGSEDHEAYDFELLLHGPSERHHRPGNHNTITGEPYVKSLADHLRYRLEAPEMVGRSTIDVDVKQSEVC